MSTQLAENNYSAIEKELMIALNMLSKGKIEMSDAKQIASDVVYNIDFSNSSLMHKGVNWFARQIIDDLDDN